MNKKFQEAFDCFVNEVKIDDAVEGILFFGSVQQGRGRSSSDLDFYVIVSGEEGWNYKKYIKGILVEAYFYTVKYWEKAIEECQHAMLSFATGTNILDSNGQLEELINRAKAIYSQGPAELNQVQRANWRITLTELLADLEGLQEDSRKACIFTGWALTRGMEAYCALNRIWPTKQEKLADHLSRLDAQLDRFIEQYENDSCVDNARTIIEYIVNKHGGRMNEYGGPRMKLKL